MHFHHWTGQLGSIFIILLLSLFLCLYIYIYYSLVLVSNFIGLHMIMDKIKVRYLPQGWFFKIKVRCLPRSLFFKIKVNYLPQGWFKIKVRKKKGRKTRHKRTKYLCVKFVCDQCGVEFSAQTNLNKYISTQLNDVLHGDSCGTQDIS